MKNLIALMTYALLSWSVAYAGIPLSTNFTVNTGLPIDDRMTVADLPARDAIPTLTRWEGMLVYVESEGKHFTLVGGISNGEWTELSGSGSGGGNSSGLLSGGALTINADTTKFDISAGKGSIVDSTDPNDIITTPVEWTAFSGVVAANLASADYTYIYIDNAGLIVQSSVFPSESLRRSLILLGRIVHIDRTAITVAYSTAEILGNSTNQLYDLLDAIGPFNIEGNLIKANSTNLSIDKSVGKLFSRGINFQTDNQKPHEIQIPVATLAEFRHATLNTFPTAIRTTLDVTNYDNGGTVTAIPGANGRATIQRVFLFPTGAIRIQYGQEWYANLAKAVQALDSESFIENANIKGVAVEIARIVVTKGCTNLQNENCAKIVNLQKFGSSGSGASGSTSLQQAYDNSVTPQITTNAISGSLDIKNNSALDSDNVLTVKNIAGDTKLSIKGDGEVSIENKLTSDNSNNGNLFVNPSFEYTLPTQGWTCAADTIVALSSDDFLTDGKKFLSITTEGIGEGCEQEVLIHTANIGKVYSVTIDAMASSVDYEVCRKEGAVEIECKNIENDIKPEKIGFIFNANVKSNTFIARAKTIALGFMRLDNANFSMTNDNGLLLDVKQATQPESCGLTASDFEGFGTPTNINLNCKRDGSKLLITGNFKTGTVQSTVAKINLKYRGSSLTVSPLAYPSISPYSSVGVFFRNLASTSSGGVLSSLGSLSYIAFSNANVFGPGSVNPLSPDNGTNVATTNEVTNINASIEIAEWQQNLNVAVSKCLEGPLKCANEYSATVIGNIVVKSDVENWITSATYSAGMHTINLNPNAGFTVPPTCFFQRYLAQTTWTSNDDGGTLAETSVSAARWMSASSQVQLNYNVTCIKQSPDNTNHDNIFLLQGVVVDPVLAIAQRLTNLTLSALSPVNFDTVIEDKFNAITTGANWKFTAPKDGLYQVVVNTYSTGATTDGWWGVTLNNVDNYLMVGNQTTLNNGTVNVRMKKNDTLSIRNSSARTVTGITGGNRVTILQVGN